MNTIFSKNFESKISLEKNFSLIALVWFNFFWKSSDIQLRSKHTRVKYVKSQEKLCLCDKRKENIQITGKEDKFQKFDIFYWKNYLKSCAEINHCDYIYVNRRRYLWVFNYMHEKKHIWNWTKSLGIFHFHLLLWNHSFKSINYSQAGPLDRLLLVLSVFCSYCQTKLPLVIGRR